MRAASRVVLNSFAPVPGFSASGIHAGLKKNGILDMAMFVSDRPCTAAGLFTTNVFAAPPVIYEYAWACALLWRRVTASLAQQATVEPQLAWHARRRDQHARRQRVHR